MALANVSTPLAFLTSLRREIEPVTKLIGRWYRQRIVYHQVIRELSSYTPRQLDDIGVAPADIPRFAQMAADSTE